MGWVFQDRLCKVTKAIKPEDSSFVETKTGGTVYVGEGSWGAPARSADDPKTWTQDLAAIQQYKVVSVTSHTMEVRTAQFDGTVKALTREERANDTLLLPAGVNWWQVHGIGDVMKLVQSQEGRSIIQLHDTIPNDSVFLMHIMSILLF